MKKLLFVLAMSTLLVCLFAFTVSASDFSAVTTDATIDLSNMSTDTTSRVVLTDGENYATYPSQYIVKSGSSLSLDFAKINTAFTKNYNKNSIVRFEVPTTVTTVPDNTIKGITALTHLYFMGDSINLQGNALRSCTALVEVNFPSTVTFTNGYQFTSCTALTTVNCEGGLTALSPYLFNGCSKLTDIDLSDTITTYPSNTLSYCSSLLMTIDLKNATTIDTKAFQSSSKLVFINANNLSSVGQDAFRDCPGISSVEFASNLSGIGSYAFKGTSVSSVKFNGGNYTIGGEAFNGLSKISGALDLTGCTSIGGSAFRSIAGITSVTAPNVTSIGDYAFDSCSQMTTFTSTSVLTSVGQNAFSGCTNLTGTFDFSVMQTIKSNAFSGCPNLETGDIVLTNVTNLGGGVFNGNKKITSAVIPEGITSTGGSLFRDCTSLKSVKIPSTVTTLNGNAFTGCTSLVTVEFVYDYEKYPEYGSALTTINNGSVFSGCTSLTTLIFPYSLTHVDNAAFSGCTSLTTLVLGPNFSTTNQSPSIPASVESLVLTPNYNMNGQLTSNKSAFTFPTTFVIYYTGTYEQAKALQEINTICYEVSRSTLVSYDEFTSEKFVRDENVHYMVYGYSTCDAFYKGVCVPSEELKYAFSGAEYITSFCSYADCTRTNCTKSLETEVVGELFTSKGYSKFEDAFMYDIKVNHKEIAEYKAFYKEVFNKEVEINYGLVASANSSYTTLINADGTVVANDVLKIIFDGTEYSKLQVKFNNVTEDLKTLHVHACAYLIVNGEVSYVGNGTTSKVSTTITYNKIKGDEETDESGEETPDEPGDETPDAE